MKKDRKKDPPEYWDIAKWESLKNELVEHNADYFRRRSWDASFDKLTASKFEDLLRYSLVRFFHNLDLAGDRFIEEMADSFPPIKKSGSIEHKWGDINSDREYINNILSKHFKDGDVHKAFSVPLLLDGRNFYRWKKQESYPSEEMLNFFVLSIDHRYRSWSLYGIDHQEPGVVLVQELSAPEDSLVKVRIRLGETQYDVTLSDSITPAQHQDLSWYFDDYINETYIAESKARRCEQIIHRVGQELYSELFLVRGENHFAKYVSSIGGFDRITIELLSKTNRFDRINWEWLREPNKSHPLISKGVVIYRRFPANVGHRIATRPSKKLHLLMVTSRPYLDRDVPYNTIQKPMVESLRNSYFTHQKESYDIQIDILRPGTFLSMVSHLRNNQGKYHIIHFDMHGIVSDYAGLLEKRDIEGGYNFRAFRSFAPGEAILDEIEPFEGTESFLLFEQEKPGIADIVRAEEFAEMISLSGVPICIVGACQTALQNEKGEEINLAKIVSNQGVDLVVAMRHSVTVDAARIFCSNLYGELRKDQPIEKSMNNARAQLIWQKDRLGRFGVNIKLEDWTIPVIYRNRTPEFNLSLLAPNDNQSAPVSIGSRNTFDQEEFGGTFIDRDNDISFIERAMLSRGPDRRFKSRFGVEGMVGEGKSTLFRYLAWWWEESNFARAVVYISFSERKWTFEEIMGEIHNRLKLPKGTTSAKTARFLNSDRVILILDDMDDRSGLGWSVLSEQDQNAMLEFLVMITPRAVHDQHFTSQSIMIARHRSVFPPGYLHDNQILTLRGLTEQETYRLTRALLNPSDKKWKELTDNHNFRRYIKLMNGNPLGIRTFIPSLKDRSPEELLNEHFGR